MSTIQVIAEAITIQQGDVYGKKKKCIAEYDYVFRVDLGEEIVTKLKEFIEEQDKCVCNDIKIISIKLVSSCVGCRENKVGGQEEHMDFGGCLFIDE